MSTASVSLAQNSSLNAPNQDFEARFLELEKGYSLSQQEYKTKLDELYRDLPKELSTDLLRWKSIDCRFLKPYTELEFSNAFTLVQSYIAQAQSFNSNIYLAEFHLCRGRLHFDAANQSAAYEDVERGIEFARDAENIKLMAYGYSKLGQFNMHEGKQANAIKWLLESQQLYEILGDAFWINDNKESIADAYFAIHDNEKALQYYLEIQDTYTKLNNVEKAMHILGRLGGIYRELKQFDKAFTAHSTQYSYFEKEGQSSDLALVNYNLGLLYIEQNQCSEALPFLNEAKNYYTDASNPERLSLVYLELGKCYLALEDNYRALALLKYAQDDIAKQGNFALLEDFFLTKAEAHSRIGEYRAAFSALDGYVNTHALADERAQKMQMFRLQTEYDVAKTKSENQKLSAESALQRSQLDSLNKIKVWQTAASVLGAFMLFLTVIFINRQRRSKQKLHALATTDHLTGLSNRREVLESGERLISSAKLNHLPFSVLVIDIDHFKKINDKYGHHGGDKVLMAISEQVLRKPNWAKQVGRIGGEEFIVLLPNNGASDAFRIAEKLRCDIMNITFNEIDPHLKVSTSIGVVTLSDMEDSLTSLINNADNALYQAKENGRNRVEVWGDTAS